MLVIFSTELNGTAQMIVLPRVMLKYFVQALDPLLIQMLADSLTIEAKKIT